MKARDLRGEGFDASEDGTGRGTPIVVHGTQDPRTGDQVFVFKQGQGAKAGSIGGNENIAPTLGAAESGTNRTPALMNGAAVRRLTPLECERLQGFPDGYTRILYRGKPAADAPRYRALGNAMAVPRHALDRAAHRAGR